MSKQWPRLVAAGLGFLWYLKMGGAGTLNPANTSWVFYGDWRQHWLGWQFFRDAPWTFPPAKLTTLLYPVGTAIGFTDSNPLVSILLKPFSPWLPVEAQFMGLWFALCFALQGYFGAALAGLATRNRLEQVLGGMLFVLSPVLAVRIGHDTLCAHWLLLAMLYLALREYDGTKSALRATWGATAIVAIAAGTHPYLAAMSFCLAVTMSVRLWADRLCTPVRAATAAVISGAAMFTMWYFCGYLSGVSTSSSGFGDFSADLLTFFNPDVLSNMGNFGLRTEPAQWEGIGYLGAGGIVAALCATGLALRVRPNTPRRVRIVRGACILLGVYALSQIVRFAGMEVLTMRTFYSPFASVVSAFRASGRFIWPLHYLILLAGVWGVSRLGLRAWRFGGVAALTAVVLMQAFDLHFDRYWLQPKPFRHVPVSAFPSVRGSFQHMALAPMQVLGVCGDPYEEDHVYRFMLLASRLKLTYNSGLFARVDAPPIEKTCAALENSINTNTLDSTTIYVVAPGTVGRFKTIGAACGRVDGDWICVSRDSDERFRTYLETGK
ncbi:MAG TPA: DUF6311 domain-containing protein [Vicinamibacterales bacterium]|nr:DUF6311 domain-containing protein [Vicinamibacterales bacterium]